MNNNDVPESHVADDIDAEGETDSSADGEGSSDDDVPSGSTRMQIDDEKQVHTQNSARPEPQQAGGPQHSGISEQQNAGALQRNTGIQNDLVARLRAQQAQAALE